MTRDMLPLRPFQREALDAVVKAHSEGVRRPAVVLPTGAGKTFLFSHLAAEHHAATGRRTLILTHRDELANQTIEEIRGVAPHLVIGKVKAEDNEVDAEVVVASVQTVSRANRLAALLRSQTTGDTPFGLVIHDECHHSASPSWARITGAFPDADHVGVTATLARGDGVGLGSVWDDVVYTKSINWMISKGYLVQPRGISVKTDLDLGSVRRTGGDYQAGDLGSAIQSAGVPAVIAGAVREYAADRRTMVFLPTVAAAYETAAELDGAGIPTAVVEGETPTEERAQIYRRFRTGEIRALVNCMVLTEGFNAPWADCVVVARPTQSSPLYQQIVGRGLRTWPGKTDCLVLDLVGATESNKLVTLIDLEEGMFPGRKPCRECWRTPCICPCGTCGGPRPCPDCREEQPAVALKGTGKDVDLFAVSRSAWLRTAGGVMFIPAGDCDILLWPNGDAFDVAEAPRAGKWTRLHTSMPLEAAMGWAEVEAEDRGESIALRGASWRKRKAPPTEPQCNLARGLGIVLTEGTTKAQLSDLISVALTSRRVDRFVRTDT